MPLRSQDFFLRRAITGERLACVAILQATIHRGIAFVVARDDKIEQIDKGTEKGPLSQGFGHLYGLHVLEMT